MKYKTSILEMETSTIEFANYKLKKFLKCEADITIEPYIGDVNLSEVVGTRHPDYIDKSWVELLTILGRDSPRAKSKIELLNGTPEYYLNEEKKETWSFYKDIDGYYIDQGNHRTVLGRFFFYLNKIEPIVHGVTIKEVSIKIAQV